MNKHSLNYPEQWQMKPLTEVISLNPNYSSPEQEDYAFIPMDALNTETMEISYYERRIQDKLTNVKIKNGDVLFARITPSTENGKGALIHNLQEPIAYGSTELVVLSPIKEIILPKFLFYITKLSRFRNRAVSLMEGATGRQRVPKFFFESQKILLPPLKEQKRIVSIIFNFDNFINYSQKLIDYLQLLKKGLMQRLFTEGIGHTEFKETKLGKIPKEWEIVTLDKIKAKIPNAIVDGPFGSNLKIIHYRKKGIPVIQSGFVTTGIFKPTKYVYIDETHFQKIKRSMVRGGDIIMAKIGAQNGMCAIMPLDHPISVLAGNSLKITTQEDKCSRHFLVNLLQYFYRTGKLEKIKTSTAQPALTISSIKKLKIPLPTMNEQEKITAILTNINQIIFSEEDYMNKLKEVKKGLMQELLTGKKRVKINNNWVNYESI